MTTSINVRPKLVRAGEGETHVVGLERVTFLLTDDDTDGVFSLGLLTVEPGGGPPPHVHHREDEVFVMLSGELQVWTPQGWFTARSGDVVFLPADVPHTHRNDSSESARLYLLANPAGFERFCAQLARLFEASGGPSSSDVAQVAEEHGLSLLPPLP
ncbi:cupin domain-containing protein [Deinococcus yavapaiensis]|uniref:Quercetin dioxygenase-like cupin family protein n=1 Tax=Deinococcus yavapaiensis KR-236 TaxID=694435 RepID=A0A318S7B5_9DEIO|nr:cupin domain-containing protein [Deinococcus yavapaiensis]PYE51080.1 quercetin dioxygenase-like cupin family protein [Deinococcus yavapaiensis KR-236]